MIFLGEKSLSRSYGSLGRPPLLLQRPSACFCNDTANVRELAIYIVLELTESLAISIYVHSVTSKVTSHALISNVVLGTCG